MKKIAFVFLSITALCTLGSCQKSELDSDSGKLTVIEASLPDGTKAALSGKQLTWTEGDKIVVSFTDNSTAEFTLTEGAGTANGKFSGTLPDGKTVSGATAKSSDLFSEGKQIYSATGFPYSLVYTGSNLENIVFDFENSSYIALTLKGAASVLVSSVEVNAGSDYILDCGSGGVALSDDGVPFYIMLTNEDVASKLKGIVVTATDGKSMTISVDKTFSEMIKSGSATSTKGHVFPSTKVFKEDIFSGGAGTSAYPFKLANAADIKDFAAYSNGTGVPSAWASFNFAAASYNVTDNITMGSDDVIAPAFTNSSAPFVGTFDGCGKTVTGLVINNTANVPCGLFSYAGSKSVIRNLKLANVKVTSNYVEAAAFVGHAEGSTLTALSVDGNANSTITSTANVTPSPANKYGSWGQAYMTVVGGIAGAVYDTNISNCTVAGRPSTKYRLAGGIVAYAGGATNITNCTIGKYSWVKAGDTLCGGIVGASQSTGTISGCKVYGTIESTKQYCGGIVGAMNSGSIKKCGVGTAGSQKAAIKGNGYNYIGGICGSITGGSPVIEECTVMNSDIISAAGAYIGYIVGQVDGNVNVNISKCVVGSKCTMTAKTWAGGILGAASNGSNSAVVIDRCSSYGSITTAANANGVGGIAGALSGVANVTNAYVLISNCLYEKGTLTATSATPNLGGIVGQCGHATLTSCPQEYIVNCYTKGATLSDSNATKYLAGIAGRTDCHNHIFGCYTDVVAGTTMVQKLDKACPIFYWMLAFEANDNSVQYVYYDNSFTAPGRGGAGVELIAPAEGISDFTSVDFLAKMNAAAAAYNAAPLVAGTEASAWVSAAGGPTLGTAIADPDQ